MLWNANGLSKHEHELQIVLDENNIDVCLIAETHFTKQSFIKFKGYNLYHTIHPSNSARGGSAIIIKETLKYSEEPKYQTEKIQATLIKIYTKKYSITLASLYSPPKHALKKEDYIVFFKHVGDRFIIGGDFNAKHTHWRSRLTTTKGKELLWAINQYNCETFSSGSPT